MATSIGLKHVRAWRALIGPGIFGSWVTGAITASGGAWNASIVSEIVSWGSTTLRAAGLGAYISDATAKGDWPRIVFGVGLMSIFVVGFNRLVWRPLCTNWPEKNTLAGETRSEQTATYYSPQSRSSRVSRYRQAANRPYSKKSRSASRRAKWWHCSGAADPGKAPCCAFWPV